MEVSAGKLERVEGGIGRSLGESSPGGSCGSAAEQHGGIIVVIGQDAKRRRLDSAKRRSGPSLS